MEIEPGKTYRIAIRGGFDPISESTSKRTFSFMANGVEVRYKLENGQWVQDWEWFTENYLPRPE